MVPIHNFIVWSRAIIAATGLCMEPQKSFCKGFNFLCIMWSQIINVPPNQRILIFFHEKIRCSWQGMLPAMCFVYIYIFVYLYIYIYILYLYHYLSLYLSLYREIYILVYGQHPRYQARHLANTFKWKIP